MDVSVADCMYMSKDLPRSYLRACCAAKPIYTKLERPAETTSLLDAHLIGPEHGVVDTYRRIGHKL